MRRILVLAHREELIHQAVSHAQTAGLKAGIEMGSHRAGREEVIVSTVQTLNASGKCRACRGIGCPHCDNAGKCKRMTKFDPHEFGLVITDEGHHGTAKSYRAVYTYFHQNQDIRFLFVTATPKRADGDGLHAVCDSVAYRMELPDAISEGWLCPIRQRFVSVDGLDLSRVTTKAGGDLKDGELERAFLGETSEEEEHLLHEIVKPTIEQAAGQQGIVFAAGVEHAHKLTAAFGAYDHINAELILGNTDKEQRRDIVKRFKGGKTQFLVNVGVATEGFDCPSASIVTVARPTKSESLYLQMIGRGTRPLAGIADQFETAEERRAAIAESAKPACIVLDFVGNSGNHKLISVADVLAGNDVDPIDLQEALAVAKQSSEPQDMEELIEKAKQAREEKERKRQEAARQRLSTKHKADRADYTATDVDLFNGASFDPFRDYTPEPGGASAKQVNYLMKLGVSPETAIGYSKRQAGAVITKLKNQTGGDWIITFGKHAGKKLRDVPKGYLNWASENINRPDFQENLAKMNGEPSVLSGSDLEAPF